MVKNVKKKGSIRHTNADVLPKIIILFSNGGVYRQDVRCGKKNCKCARGETHTAYYYMRRSCGTLTKTYIPKAQLKEFREAVDERVEWRNRFRDSSKARKAYLKKLREQARMEREMGIVEERVDGCFPRRVGEYIERRYPEQVEAWRKEALENLNQE